MRDYRRSADVNRTGLGANRAWRGPVLAGLLATALLFAGAPARAQQVLAVVNGVPITSFDVEQRAKLTQLSTHKSPPRKEVLEELINEQLKTAEAKRYGVEATKTEIDSALTNMATRLGMKSDQLAHALQGQGVHIQTLRSRIRGDLSWSHLVRGRFSSSLTIGDRDIQTVIDQKDGGKETVGYIYTLRPILLIVPQGSPPGAYEARRREADALRTRFEGCDKGVAMARRLRDVAVREQVFRNSADLPEAFRTVLNQLAIGKLTTPEVTRQGIEVFALCDRKETRANTPQKEEARQEIFNKRYEAQSKHYLDQLRRGAMIEYK
jgi:peptidyl-prolyl cis-trans isomerase SurA